MIKKNLSSALLLSLSISAHVHAGEQMDKILSRVEGTYELIEWDDAGKKYLPPTVSARYVIRDGAITWVSYKNSDGKQVNNALYGSYKLTETSFSYGYSNWLEVTTEGSDTKVSREFKPDMASMNLPNMRTLMISVEGNVVRASAGNNIFEFREDGFEQTNKSSGFTRKYRRVVK